MPAAPQLSLTLRDARWRPLLGMNAVMGALGMDAEEVNEQLDLGNIVAFNIAVAIPGKRELRCLTASVVLCRDRLDNPKVPRVDWPWHKIFDCILRHEKPFVTGPEVDAALNCDPDHRLNLICAGRLEMVPGTTFRPGRNGAPLVTRASFEQFLKGRKQ